MCSPRGRCPRGRPPIRRRSAWRCGPRTIRWSTPTSRGAEGEYGAGTVLVWDRGTYRNLKEEAGVSVEDALEDGHLTVWLEGEKLRGGYALTQTEMRGDPRNWLLVKMDDDEADARRNPTSTQPESVLTGRTLEQVAAAEGE